MTPSRGPFALVVNAEASRDWALAVSAAQGNDSPVPLHVDDHPSALRGFIQTAHELPDVGIAVVRPLAFGVGVMNDDAEPRPLRAGRPLEEVAV